MFVLLGIVLISASIFERLPYRFYSSAPLNNKAYQKIVRDTDSKAIMDIPVNIFDPSYNILSLEYEKPIINGYFHWSADGPLEKSLITDRGLIARYSCGEESLSNISLDKTIEENSDREMLDLLKANGITTLVLHKEGKFFHPVCRNVRMRISRLFPFEYPAEVTGENSEKQVVANAMTGYPTFNFYLPYDGTFYIDGVYFDPSNTATLLISIDGQPAELGQSWTEMDNGLSKEISPKYSINFKAKAGSTLSFHSETIVENSSFSLWYRYVREGDNFIPRSSYFEKIFEDEETLVYKLN
jgi:hypothetical protein